MISPAWLKAKRFRMGSTTADRIGSWSTYESPMIRRNLRWKASGGPRGYPGNCTGKKLFGGAAITHLRRCWGSNGNRLRAWKLNLQSVSYTHLRAHETVLDLVCRLLLEKKK